MEREVVHLVSTQDLSYLLRKMEKVHTKEASVVKGIVCTPGSWVSDCFVEIPLNTIRYIVEFSSIEDYEERVKSHDDLGDFPLEVLNMDIGFQLIPLVDTRASGGDLLERIKKLRLDFFEQKGFSFPPIRIKDANILGKNEYAIRVKGVEKGKGEVYPGRFLIIDKDPNKKASFNAIQGDPCKEPVFGLSAKWISNKNDVPEEIVIADANSVLISHLHEIISMNTGNLFTREKMSEIIDTLRASAPSLVEGVIPEQISLSKIHRVFQFLVDQGVHLRRINDILEVIGDRAHMEEDVEVLSNQICEALKH